MKKLALVMVGVFTLIFGGLVLASCQNKVSLTLDTNQVEIYTNNIDAENYLKKEVNATLKNSSAGVFLEVLSGGDSVRLSSNYAQHTNNDTYTFTIFGEKSGEALVRATSIEDTSQNQIIEVSVKTIIEKIEIVRSDSEENRTNQFVVKNVSKKLKAEQFFNYQPQTANVTDIKWAFANNEDIENKQLTDENGNVVAQLVDDVLTVGENYSGQQIGLIAYLAAKPTTRSEVLSFEVLENATVESLILSDGDGDRQSLYVDGQPRQDEEVFYLKRNDKDRSNIKGALVVNSAVPVDLEAVVCNESGKQLSVSDYSQYFNFEVTSVINPQEGERNYTFNFVLNAFDTDKTRLYGNFRFYLRIKYRNYLYDFVTEDTNVRIETAYTVEGVDVSNENGDIVSYNDVPNEIPLDVYSFYSNSTGRALNVTLRPDDGVALDNNMFRVGINLQQSALSGLNIIGDDGQYDISRVLRILYRGRNLTFTQQGQMLYSSELQSGAQLNLLAGQLVTDVIEDLQITFEPRSDARKLSIVKLNLYHISEGASFDISKGDGTPIDEAYLRRYVSSKSSSNKTLEYSFKINGLTSLNYNQMTGQSDLFLASDNNPYFEFSRLIETRGDDYVIVSFSVTLNSSDIESSTKFWFEHVTGKKSQEFAITAFMPLESASIENGNKQSSNVFTDTTSTQNYVLTSDGGIGQSSVSSESLSRLKLEAGTNLPLKFDYDSLSTDGITFKFLSISDTNYLQRLQTTEHLDSFDGAMQRAEDLFLSDEDITYVATTYFNCFSDIDGTLFGINTQRLTLRTTAFKGYVAVLFHGFNDNYQSQTLVRVFALESFYSVRAVLPSVRYAQLYTTETLTTSDEDLAKSRINVTITLRTDDNIPTYTNDLSYFTFTSTQDAFREDNASGYFDRPELKQNAHYTVDSIKYISGGRVLSFTVIANSTQFDFVFNDILTISYDDGHGSNCMTEIELVIKNVNRVEHVYWTNQTQDGQIYFNAFEQSQFLISTNVLPADANDLGIYPIYAANAPFDVQTMTVGQNFNLSFTMYQGGVDYLYLVPNDMVKRANDGTEVLLLYRMKDDGNLEAVYDVPVDQIALYYDDIVGNGEDDENAGQFCNYFYNLDVDGQTKYKVYNKDIILKIRVIVADGESDETAIRIYSSEELKHINTNLHYQIMNDMTLQDWSSFNELRGSVFGLNQTTTLTLTGESETFVNQLYGSVHDLTFVGNVTAKNQSVDNQTTYAGFVASVNRGNINNVYIDVIYQQNGQEDGKYVSSKLTADASYVGALAGVNYGAISNATIGGLSVEATASFVGSLVGRNEGSVTNCAVEFYKFADGINKVVVNKEGTNTFAGGLVGFATETSTIESSYVYAYPLEDFDNEGTTKLFEADTVGAFAGRAESGAKVSKSFAYIGSEKSPCETGENFNLTNSYITYFELQNGVANISTTIYDAENSSVTLTKNDIPNQNDGSENWKSLVEKLDGEVWQLQSIDSKVNFGFMYLRDLTQTLSISTDSLVINTVEGHSQQVGADKGILFVYAPNAVISDEAEQAHLNALNTIYFEDLFAISGHEEGLSEKEARSLIVSCGRQLIVNTTSIRLTERQTTAFDLSVRSKMDLTAIKKFKVVVLNNLPDISTKIVPQDEYLSEFEIQNGQTILLQKGSQSNVVYTLDDSISLNGKVYSSEDTTVYQIGSKPVDKNISLIQKTSTSLLLTGVESHSQGKTSQVETYLTIQGLEQDYEDAVQSVRTCDFSVSVFDGATGIASDATTFDMIVGDHAVFNITLATDNQNDSLLFTLTNNNISHTLTDENSVLFALDDQIDLSVSWSKSLVSEGVYNYRVIVKISEETKHLVEKDIENLTLTIMPLSQQNNERYRVLISAHKKLKMCF